MQETRFVKRVLERRSQFIQNLADLLQIEAPDIPLRSRHGQMYLEAEAWRVLNEWLLSNVTILRVAADSANMNTEEVNNVSYDADLMPLGELDENAGNDESDEMDQADQDQEDESEELEEDEEDEEDIEYHDQEINDFDATNLRSLDLEAMTRAQLIELAEEHDIEVEASGVNHYMTKDDLISAINNYIE